MKSHSTKTLDLTGHIYGRLTVLSFAGIRKGRREWNCLCSCGKHTIASGIRLRTGNTKSCGCARVRSKLFTSVTHGYNKGGKKTKEYRAWYNIRTRILGSHKRARLDYGGRGIKILYKSFQDFLNDVGLAPSPKHSIDRIDNNGHYGPGNCRWADPITQANNKRNNVLLTYKGQTKCLTEWCRALNLNYDKISRRLYLNWPVEKMFEL